MRLRKIEKKGAIELSMTTIVVVVLSLTLLILGFVLVRSIMCGAINLTGDVNDKIRDQINSFFSSTADEFSCIGESGSSVSLIPGQTNMIYCGVRAPEEARYEIEVDINYGVSDISRKDLRDWFQSMNFNQDVAPGDQRPKQVARIQVPKNAPEGDVIFDVEVSRDGSLIGSTTLNYEVSRQGVINGFIC